MEPLSKKFSDLSVKEFVDASNEAFDNKYSYPHTFKITSNDKIGITCPIHSTFFKIPYKHLVCKQGCPLCATHNSGVKPKFSEKEFIEKSKSIWGKDRFEYLDIVTALHKKSTFKCNCGNIFTQTGQNHFRFNGCKACNIKKGWTRTQWLDFCKYKNVEQANLYIAILDTEPKAVKVGITAREVKERFYEIPFAILDYTIIRDTPGNVYDLEKVLLRLFKDNKKLNSLDFGGKTECFVSESNLITLSI